MVFPIKVELSSLCISLKEFVSDEDYRVARLAQLDLLDNSIKKDYDHLQIYQTRIKRKYKKVHPHEFEVWSSWKIHGINRTERRKENLKSTS